MNIAVPASLPSRVKKVVSTPPSVPLKIISESLACASIVILPEVVVIFTAASPALISSAAEEELPLPVTVPHPLKLPLPLPLPMIVPLPVPVLVRVLVLPSPG